MANLSDLIEDDDDVLGRTLDALFSSENLDSLLDSIMGICRQAVDSLGDVARAIVEIVVSSVEQAQDVLNNLDYDIVTLVIAHYVRAAIDGAEFGSRLVARAPRQARVAGAVAGAVVAGTAGSNIGYEDAKDAKDRETMRRAG